MIAAVEAGRQLYAVRRAETGTGADYYIGPMDADLDDDLENCFRLEVSGVDRGGEKEVRILLSEKVTQARKGKSSLPAIAGVVGFDANRVLILQDVSP